jgi:hypothetical protein
MPKGYWKGSGQFLKSTGKPERNDQIPAAANRRGGRIAQRLSAKTWRFPFISLELQHFYIYSIIKKSRIRFKNLKKSQRVLS